MQWILRFFVVHRSLTSLFVASLLCVLMLSSPPARQQWISRALTMSVFYPFQFYFSQTERIKNIYAENRRLKEQVAFLSVKVAQLTENVRENERLTDLLGISSRFSFTLAPARVVARDPSYLSRSAIIDVGKNEGVAAYMPVITSRGVAGKIVQAMGRMSLVQLLVDPANRTGVMIGRSRETGILETVNGSDFSIMFRAHADVEVGDTIVTSGLGGIYPKGLLAGTVTKLEEGRDPIFKKAFVKLEVNLDRLEEVFVIKQPSQWAAFRDELDSLEAAP
jgi:rod shape-determining protein MreC